MARLCLIQSRLKAPKMKATGPKRCSYDFGGKTVGFIMFVDDHNSLADISRKPDVDLFSDPMGSIWDVTLLNSFLNIHMNSCFVVYRSYPRCPSNFFFKPFSAICNPIRETDKEHERIPSLVDVMND